MTAADRGAWRLDIFAVERDGARLVWTGPWPAHGDPERAALELGQDWQWLGGLYELQLVAGDRVRARRNVALGLPGPPRRPASVETTPTTVIERGLAGRNLTRRDTIPGGGA